MAFFSSPTPRSTPRRALSVGAVAVALALAVSGCSNAEEADVVGTASPATSQSVDSSAPSATEAEGYAPATKDHPARNVPKPMMPAEAHKETFEGAVAFMGYWQESMKYLIETGDPRYVQEVTDRNNDEYTELFKKFKEIYSSGNWIVAGIPQYKMEEGGPWEKTNEFYVPVVYQSRPDGGEWSKSGKIQDIPGEDYNGQPQEVYLEYKGGNWLFVDIGNISDVDYGG